MEGEIPEPEMTRIQERFLYLAWRRYRIPRGAGEDIVQTALLTFLQVKDRYPRVEEHKHILAGIFRNKCREYIDETVRASRKRRTLLAKMQGGHDEIRIPASEMTTEDGVVGELVRDEESSAIMRALAELRPPAREMFQLITEKGLSRQELIEFYDLNRNTLDSRLHAYRREFRRVLERHGITI